jgi:hypothetical protein
MARFLATLVALVYLGNGVHMLVDPSHWYASIPGVTASGPMNVHFIRDIGFIYLLSGAAFAFGVARPSYFGPWSKLSSQHRGCS